MLAFEIFSHPERPYVRILSLPLIYLLVLTLLECKANTCGTVIMNSIVIDFYGILQLLYKLCHGQGKQFHFGNFLGGHRNERNSVVQTVQTIFFLIFWMKLVRSLGEIGLRFGEPTKNKEIRSNKAHIPSPNWLATFCASIHLLGNARRGSTR